MRTWADVERVALVFAQLEARTRLHEALVKHVNTELPAQIIII